MQRGFTLIEVLLSLAAIAIIAAFTIPLFRSLQVTNDLNVAATTVVRVLRFAEARARASAAQSEWGVRIEAGAITLFKGSSFSGRDPGGDDVYAIASTITPTGLNEIVFQKVSGLPKDTGTITLTSLNENLRTITINAKGTVNY